MLKFLIAQLKKGEIPTFSKIKPLSILRGPDLHNLDDVPPKGVNHATGVDIAGKAQKFTNIVYRA